MIGQKYSYIRKYLFIFSLIFLFSGCDIVDAITDVFNGEDDISDDELLTSATIGTNGGKINADGLTLTIPAGSFSESVEINIYSSSVTDVSIEDIASKVYKIEGLPDQYSKPIDVRIKHNGNISEESYLVLQEDSYIPSLDSIAASNIYFDAVVVGDSIKSQIPAITSDLAKVASVDDIYMGPTSVKIYSPSNKRHYITSHFNIYYDSIKDDETDVAVLGQYLEYAYTKIQGIGFSYARRTSWPMQVSIFELANNIYGYHCTSRLGLNSHTLEFNRLHLSKQTEMKTTAIHEFFHFVQYLRDGRFFLIRGTTRPPHHWFNEACSVWSEELVTNSQYNSISRGLDTDKKPFNGLQAGSEINASNHGYGMSAFIKYIVKKYGQNILVNIYDEIFAGKHVVDAINQSMNEMLFIEYNLFLQQYAHTQLYPDFGLRNLVDIFDDEFEIKTDTDVLKTFSAKYRELSGKIYSVKLDNPNFKDDTSLEISIDQELCHITVFQFPEPINPFNILAEGGKSCIVSDLKGLKAQNKRLFVIVTNGNLIKIPEYSPSSKDINVKMEINKDHNGSLRFLINGCVVDRTEADVTDRMNNRYIEEVLSFGGSNGSYYYQSLGRTYSGTVNITFIDNPKSINFHLDGGYTYESIWGFGTVTFRYTVDFNGIPYQGLEGAYQVYSVTDRAVQSGYFTWSETNGRWKDELISVDCGDGAYIRVEVDKRE